jgi:phage terminase large subunit
MAKEMEIPCEFERLLDTDWREASVHGGRFSLKSHTVARVLLIRARQSKIRVACFREFQNSISESSHQLLKDLIEQYELTDFEVTDKSIINRLNGSDFIFKGLHRNEQNVKSTEGIDLCWVEESQTVSKSSLEVLTPTVRKDGSQIIYTYNRLLENDPIYERLIVEGRPNTLVINVNYDVALKYGWMPEIIRLEMEDDKEKRNGLYQHKWLGLPNNVEGRIYSDWEIIDEIPHEARLWRRGLDFGYSIDPSVLVDIYEYNGGYIIDEMVYRKGLSNKAIADIINNQPEQCLVIADSAEPKSIDEIASYGISILGAKKGPGSVSQGIQVVQGQKISITRKSEKTITAYRNFTWKIDVRSTDHLPVPDDTVHEWSNPMDAIRYGFNGTAGDSTASRVQKEKFQSNQHNIINNNNK